MANVYEPQWDAARDEPPHRWRRARLGRQTGARQLGASLFELPPGAESFQYGCVTTSPGPTRPTARSTST